MCKEHMEEVLGLLAMIGSNVPDCVEIVALVTDKEGGKAVIVTSVDIDATVEHCRKLLALAEETQRQLRAGVVHHGPVPPTAH